MLYDLELNKNILKQHIYKSNIINKVIDNNTIDYYKIFRPYINEHAYLFEPYHYLKKIINKPIYYFIIIEIINKYNINKPTILFSNSQQYINSIYEMYSNIEFITKNKLCPYKKRIIYNYSHFINTYKNMHDTIIIHYDDYKQFITNIFVSLFIQKNNGTLIFNIPSTNTDTHLNILHFLMYYYNIRIIKPFATNIYTDERYVICTNYKRYVNKQFLEYGECIFNMIGKCKQPYLYINELPYFYLKLILQENTIWVTHVINDLSKYLLDTNKEYANEQNIKSVYKWYANITK